MWLAGLNALKSHGTEVEFAVAGQQEAASTALQVVPAPVDLRAEASRLLQAQQCAHRLS